jgi:hypothetical protein
MPVPSPTEVKPWYLRNITEALALDEPSGNVYVRTGFEGNIIISGNVNIPGTVTVNSSPADPVHTHVSEVGTSGILTVPYMPIGGNVIVDSGNITVNGSVSATVSGTVNIGTMPEVEIKNDSGNAIPIVGNVTLAGNSVVTLGSTQTDAFGRLRVSEPYTLFDTQSRYYDHGQFDSATANGGSVSYIANSSTFELSVTTANASSVIRETKRVFPYQPGKSLLIFSTFCMSTPKTNLTQRVGFYGAQNGIYFEVVDNTYNMVIRSYTSGGIVEDRIPQSLWNGDKLNGAGGSGNPSGITLYPDRDQIFWTDVEWLGVGSVRCGFIINGAYYTCHTFHHANIIGNTTTYMTTATLPLRYEIFNTGITSGASMMRQICSTVISEGGYNNFGTTQLAGVGITQKNLATSGTYYPIVSIRLAPTRLDSIIVPRQVDMLSPSVDYFRWVLLQNATLTGATWAYTSATGTVQYDLAATGISGGQEIQSGYVSSRELSELTAVNFFQYQLGRTLAGVSDTVTLALASTGNNAKILAQLGWQELT